MWARMRQAIARLLAPFRSRRLDLDLEEDLATHLELLTDDFIRAGMAPEAARREARLRFGSMVSAAELHRDVRSLRAIEMAGLEMRWAFRAVRARGWEAALIVLLLGVALAANTVVFSAADAFVFRRAPYLSAERLAVLYRQTPETATADYISVASVREWRRQTDLLAEVHAHAMGGLFYLTMAGVTEPANAELVTPGLFDMLGAVPKWGRPLVEGDAAAGAPEVALIAEELATALFGHPAHAVGQTLPSPGTPIEIIGVMAEAFRFPTGAQRIWRPLDLETREQNNNVRNVARLAAGVPFQQAQAGVEQRGPGIDSVTERRSVAGRMVRIPRKPLTLRRLADVRGDTRYSAVFGMLAAAAGCLLLIACANVAGLELAATMRRSRAFAVQAALGASRTTLIRCRMYEVAMLLTAGTGTAALLAWWGGGVVTRALPPAMARQLSNAIDVDARAVLFMLALAAVAFVAASVPGIMRIAGGSLIDSLRDDARIAAGSRASAVARQFLVVGQIAATVVLLVGALLYARTYASKVGIDKGFDSRNLITLSVLPAPDAPLRGDDLITELRGLLAAHPGVDAFARSATLPPSTQAGITSQLSIDARPPNEGRTKLSGYGVAPEYFATLGVPIIGGRVFAAHEPLASVVVDEAFARRFWPEGQAVGSRFGIAGASIAGTSVFDVVGVSRAVRQDRTTTEGGEEVFVFYYPVTARSQANFVARLSDKAAFAGVIAAVRHRAPRSVVRADFIEERYARLEGDSRLAASATTGLSVLALLIATLGVYALMAFIVSGRTREIGIRMALGARVGDIRREVFAASLRFVVAGAVAGTLAALIASRWIESQLYGVSPTDLETYAAAGAGVLIAAALATWYPARQAARVDPAITLRSQ